MPTLDMKPKRKVSFSEQDVATLTHRYDARTLLTLLQEVANYPHPKIDWNELVKKTSTRISNAREYQLLWRHLAYRHALPENPDDAAEPLDDHSDLECELEASPPISADSVSEATACVKVMIESHKLSESTTRSSTIEAPLLVNVPVCHSSTTLNESSMPSKLMQGRSIIFPVTVQRTPLATVSSTEGIETRGLVGSNMASKRKRTAWSEEEDMQLRAAVHRWGEGNWAIMAKGDSFNMKRTPTQLYQRWNILRRKDGSSNPGPVTPAEHQAARESLSCALADTFRKSTVPGATNPARTSLNTSTKSHVQPCNTVEALTISNNFAPTQNLSQKAAVLESCDNPAMSKLTLGKPLLKCDSATNSTMKSSAVTSEARIVSLSNNVSQFKVAQARKAANIVHTSSSLAKPTVPVGLCSNPKLADVRTCSSVATAPVPSNSAIAVTSLASCTSTIKTEETFDSDPIPTSKDRVQVDETAIFTTGNHHMQVCNNLNKGRQDLNQGKGISLPLNRRGETPTVEKASSEEISKDKAV